MKLRFLWGQLFACVVAVLVFWGQAAGAESAPAAPQAGPTLAQYLPADAPLLVSLLDSPTALQQLKADLPGATGSTETAQAIAQWPQALLGTAGLNYQRDIQPWVDTEVMLALTHLERNSSNQRQPPGYLLALTTKRASDARACLEQLWQQQVAAGLPLTYRRYQGISIVTVDRSTLAPVNVAAGLPNVFPPFSELAAAVVGGRQVLIADSLATLKTAIESSQDLQQNLTGTTNYQAALSQLQQQPQLGFVYCNFVALADQSGFFTNLASPRYQSLVVGLERTSQGLLAETLLVSDPDLQAEAIAPRVSKGIAALDFVPAQSAFVAAGVDLDQLWQQVQTQLSSYPQLLSWIKALLAQGGKPWRLRLAQDILPAVSGDYALAMLPPDQASLRTRQTLPLNADWVFVLDKRPGHANQDVALTIDDAAEQQKIGVFPYQLGNQQVSAWAHLAPTQASSQSTDLDSLTLDAELTGGYATKQGHRVMATSLKALEQALAGAPRSLAQDSGFQAAIASFERPNQGYLYLDWPVMRPILESKIPLLLQLEQWVGPWLKHLQSVSVANYGETPTVLRSHILLQWH